MSKATEGRLTAQVTDLRDECKRQSILSDSIRKIEAGLTGRLETEREQIVQDKERLQKALDNSRKVRYSHIR